MQRGVVVNLEHHLGSGHDRKVDSSTSTRASLLRPWIRFFTIIISARRKLDGNKQQTSVKNKTQPKNSELMTTPKRVWIRAMCCCYVINCDRKIKSKEGRNKVD